MDVAKVLPLDAVLLLEELLGHNTAALPFRQSCQPVPALLFVSATRDDALAQERRGLGNALHEVGIPNLRKVKRHITWLSFSHVRLYASTGERIYGRTH